MTLVALAVTDGMPLFELSIPCTIFGPGNPEAAGAGYELVVCGAPGATVGGWLRSETPHTLDDLVKADTVIVPACDEAMERAPADLVEAVRAAHERGARVASICTGAFVLAAAGLLDGRRATTHWMYARRLADDYPQVDVDPGVLYIDEGDVLTSAGQAAGIDLCLHMVRSDLGATMANTLALETTDSSIEQIAEQVGMGTATTLRRNFHRIVGRLSERLPAHVRRVPWRGPEVRETLTARPR